MDKRILKDREALTKLVANADSYLASLRDAFEHADMNEQEFKTACHVATQSIIIKAAVNSMKIMQENKS